MDHSELVEDIEKIVGHREEPYIKDEVEEDVLDCAVVQCGALGGGGGGDGGWSQLSVYTSIVWW